MSARRKTPISPRKLPQQARSAELVATILEAAIRVLEKEGAQRFTAARVAERAGVSVGSLYQYFPNKAAILFRLQSDEWGQTSELLRSILADRRKPVLDRLRILVHSFVRSECDEAAMRTALDDAAPLYRDAPEAEKAKASGKHAVRTFMQEALPNTSDAARELAGDLMTLTLSSVGKHLSESRQTREKIEAFADSMADMFCAYLKDLNLR
jgi:AcrR family transcriptional regulator